MEKREGSIALVGSGEYLPVMEQFERSLLEDGCAQGKIATYVQIPTAAGRESADRLKYWEELGAAQANRLGVKQNFLPIFNREDAMNPIHAEAIKNSALMYLSGGDPHYLAETLSGTPTWDAIVENWETGASLAGCSAGAMAMSEHIPPFRILKKEPSSGLSLLPNLRVIPHFNKFFKWIPEAAAQLLMHAPEGVLLLGVDENTAIVRRSGSSIWEVVGEANVHILKGAPHKVLSAGESLSLPI